MLALSPAPTCLESTGCRALADDLGRQEYQQFGLARRIGSRLEQVAESRDVTQQGHLHDVRPIGLLKDPANHDRTPVLDKHLRLDRQR